MLLPWIDKSRIDYKLLSMNESSDADELLIANSDKIYWEYFSDRGGPLAEAHMRANLDKVSFKGLARSESKYAVELMRANLDKIDKNCWQILSCTHSPYAIALLAENPEMIDHSLFASSQCGSDEAIALKLSLIPSVRTGLGPIDYDDYRDHGHMFWLGAANTDTSVAAVMARFFHNDLSIEDIKNNIKTMGCTISQNPHPIFVDLLLSNPECIDSVAFSQNPNPRAIAYLAAHPEKIYWGFMASNPSPDALALCRANIDKLDSLRKGRCSNWNHMAFNNRNSEAFRLISENPEKLKLNPYHGENDMKWYKRSLSKEEIEFWNTQPNHINWSAMSRNTSPAAIEFLSQNIDKIDWKILSANPAIFVELPVSEK